MNKDYFDEYYSLERKHWWFQSRLKIIELHLMTLLPKNVESQQIKILNVGAGTGLTSEVLSKYGAVTSVEYDEDCISMVKEKTGMIFEHESITALPYPDNSFDIVTAFDVIEHVEDHQLAVSELIRVCKKDGKLFTTVPAYMFMWSNHDTVNQHIRRYTLKNYRKLWESNTNIEHIYSTYFNFHLFLPIASFRLLGKLIPDSIFRKGAGSDFTVYKQGSLDKLFYKLMLSEKFYIRKKIRLPFGISILCSYKKK